MTERTAVESLLAAAGIDYTVVYDGGEKNCPHRGDGLTIDLVVEGGEL